MKHLDGAQRLKLEHMLAARQRALLDDIHRELQQSDQQQLRDLADRVRDSGDESVSRLIADLDAAAIDRDVRELREVEAARVRLKTASYGMCADCGEPIAWARLLAQPVALRCIACATRHERGHAHESAPKL
jgi:RNA polymerase-binding protein DksA